MDSVLGGPLSVTEEEEEEEDRFRPILGVRILYTSILEVLDCELLLPLFYPYILATFCRFWSLLRVT